MGCCSSFAGTEHSPLRVDPARAGLRCSRGWTPRPAGFAGPQALRARVPRRACLSRTCVLKRSAQTPPQGTRAPPGTRGFAPLIGDPSWATGHSGRLPATRAASRCFVRQGAPAHQGPWAAPAVVRCRGQRLRRFTPACRPAFVSGLGAGRSRLQPSPGGQATPKG